MRAMVVTKYGGPEVLQLRDMPTPVPGDNDLLVEVVCAAMNPVDFKIRTAPRWGERKFPFILGYDVSGIVRGMGRTVTGFKVGDDLVSYLAVDFCFGCRHGLCSFVWFLLIPLLVSKKTFLAHPLRPLQGGGSKNSEELALIAEGSRTNRAAFVQGSMTSPKGLAGTSDRDFRNCKR